MTNQQKSYGILPDGRIVRLPMEEEDRPPPDYFYATS